MAVNLEVVIVMLLVPILTVRTFHVRPPIQCELGRRNTTGPRANTEYEVIDIQDCNKKNLPKLNCTTVPGSPQNTHKNVTGYGFGLVWEATDGAGGDASVLKGFVINISVLPYDRGRNPLRRCLYINITKTFNSQYVSGILRFHCEYREDSEVTISIQSYPTPDMCAGAIERKPTTIGFFLPTVQEKKTSVTKSTTKVHTSKPVPIENITIVTVLSCSLLFVLAVVVAICLWRKVYRGSSDVHKTKITSRTGSERSNDDTSNVYVRPSATARNRDNSKYLSELSECHRKCSSEISIFDDHSDTIMARETYHELCTTENDSNLCDVPPSSMNEKDNCSNRDLKTIIDTEEWNMFTQKINFPNMFTSTDL